MRLNRITFHDLQLTKKNVRSKFNVSFCVINQTKIVSVYVRGHHIARYVNMRIIKFNDIQMIDRGEYHSLEFFPKFVGEGVVVERLLQLLNKLVSQFLLILFSVAKYF